MIALRTAIAAALATALYSSAALADQSTTDGQKAAAAPSENVRPVAHAEADPPAAKCADSGLCGDQLPGCESEATEEASEDENEPWRLIGDIGWGINVNGWLDMGVTANSDDPPSKYNGILAPNDRDEFQFNQVYLVMERALNTEDRPWDVGGRVDLLYGTDWIYGQALGLESHPDGTRRWNDRNHYGLILPQFYGELGNGDLSLKLGHQYTTIGYESLMPVNNFFYSMNYALRYAEPTTHTGGLLTWKTTDELSLWVGGFNGHDRFDGQSDSFHVLLGFGYNPSDKKTALTFSMMTGGKEDGILPVEGPRTYFSTVFTWNISEKLQSVSQVDAGFQQNFDLAGDNAQFYSLTEYLFYTINDSWKAGLRYDWFRDDDGYRLIGLRFAGTPGGNPFAPPLGANVGSVHALSAGVNWTPHPNLRLRPEVRWDWYEGRGLPPFDDGTDNNQFVFAIDLLVLF